MNKEKEVNETAREWLERNRLGLYFKWEVRVSNEYDDVFKTEWYILDNESDYSKSALLNYPLTEVQIDYPASIINLYVNDEEAA